MPLAFWLWSCLPGTAPATTTMFSHFGICVLFRAKPSDERTNNEQSNAAVPFRFGAAAGPSRGSACRPLRCHAQKRDDSKVSFVFNNQNLISHFEGCHLVLSACTAVVRPPFRVRGCVQTITRNDKQGGNASGHLPGQTTRISMA